MPTYSIGDVLLIDFPYADTRGVKKRPALLVFDAGDADVIVARVTGQLYNSPYDVKVGNWRRAGLRMESIVRLHKLATLEKAIIDKSLGRLEPGDLQVVRAKLHEMFSTSAP